MLERFKLLVLLFLAACFMLFGAWRTLYPNRNDPKSMQYVLWTNGLYSLDPEVALGTMVGDRYRSKLVLGKSKSQLDARFGFLTPIRSASEYDQIAYRDLGLPNSGHEVFVLRQSTWLVVFTDGRASDLILVKGN